MGPSQSTLLYSENLVSEYSSGTFTSLHLTTNSTLISEGFEDGVALLCFSDAGILLGGMFALHCAVFG